MLRTGCRAQLQSWSTSTLQRYLQLRPKASGLQQLYPEWLPPHSVDPLPGWRHLTSTLWDTLWFLVGVVLCATVKVAMAAFRTEEVLKDSVGFWSKCTILRKRTPSSFKTIILTLYFDTSFFPRSLRVVRLFFWRESVKGLVLSSISLKGKLWAVLLLAVLQL